MPSEYAYRRTPQFDRLNFSDCLLARCANLLDQLVSRSFVRLFVTLHKNLRTPLDK